MNYIEFLKRPFLTGPMGTKTQSAADQFAGRTSILSGGTSATVSTRMVNSDSLLQLTPHVALAAEFQTQGIIAIASGAGYKTASTTAIYSGDTVLISPLLAAVASGFGRTFKVDSIVDGVSFAIGTQDGLGPGAGGAVMWKIPGKEPVGLKVATISPGNFFTIAWADGAPRNYPTPVMWEIRTAS